MAPKECFEKSILKLTFCGCSSKHVVGFVLSVKQAVFGKSLHSSESARHVRPAKGWGPSARIHAGQVYIGFNALSQNNITGVRYVLQFLLKSLDWLMNSSAVALQ